MTNIELGRWLIADRDPENYLFSDSEVNELLERNILFRQLDAEPLDLENKIFEIKTPYTILSDESLVVRDEDGAVVDSSTYSVNYDRHLIIFNNATEHSCLSVECYILDEDNFRADAFERIVVDFRKLQAYSVQTMEGNLDTAKEHLLRLIRHFRIPR
jgi:hypothetical protein